MRIKVTENFSLDELVDKPTYDAFGAGALRFIDMRIVSVAQRIRQIVGRSVTINNWWHGGPYSLSGLRPFDAAIGAKFSQHKFGRALDLKVAGMSSAEMAHLVQNNWAPLSTLGLTTIEDPAFTVSTRGGHDWLHIDCRHTGQAGLLIVKP